MSLFKKSKKYKYKSKEIEVLHNYQVLINSTEDEYPPYRIIVLAPDKSTAIDKAVDFLFDNVLNSAEYDKDPGLLMIDAVEIVHDAFFSV